MPLYHVPFQRRCRVLQVPDDTQIKQMGLYPGVTVEIISRHPLGGPLIIRIGQRDIAIDKRLALAIEAELLV